MKTFKNISSLIICLLLLVCTMAAAQPEADFKKLSKTYTLHADGSMELRCVKELTLNTHIAMNSLYGETFIVYNPQYQSVKFHTTYTKQADGTIVKVPENAFNEVLPRTAADAPAYNHLKEMVVTHTGLELGATIYLDYSVLTKPGYYPALDICETLQEQSPVKEYTLSINIPAGLTLNYVLSGSKVKPVVKDVNGSKQYQWIVKNIPAASLAQFKPLDDPSVPRLAATTYLSNEAALTAWSYQCDLSLNDESKAFTKSLLNGIESKDKLISQLHNYVVKQISTVNLPLEDTGYKLRNNNDVLRSSYGTPAEKTVLLMAMLQLAGFNPEQIVVYPSEQLTGLKPIREFAIRCNERYLSAVKSSNSIPQRGELDKVLSVSYDQITPLEIKAQPVINTAKHNVPASELQARCGDAPYFVYTLTTENLGVKSWGMDRLNSKRKEMLEIPYLTKDVYTYTITLPEGMTMQTLPSEINLSEPFGKLNISISQQDSIITVNRSIELTKLQIMPNEYAAFRNMINTWNDNTTNQLIIEQNK